MSELKIAEDIQRELYRIKVSENPDVYLFQQPDINNQGLPGGAVVINDWMSFLSAPNENAPYAVIGISDNWKVNGVQTNDGSDIWEIPLDLVEKFVDYYETRNLLRDHRQLIIDHLTSPTYYDNQSGVLAFGIRSIRSVGLIYDILDRFDEPETIRNRYPIFIGQTMILTVEEKSIS